jgi:histidinol dehydrogenase
MTVIPAQTAGVKRIVAATPPSKKPLHPAMAYSFKVLKLKEIYRIGGAQAIAALALGTKRVPAVDKIAGPGNLYVSLAKKILYGKIDIDMVAGPSEILVIADRSANPEFAARDLLSQAEHGTGRESAVLLTDSVILARAVQKCVKKLLSSGRAGQKAKKAIQNYGMIGVLRSLKACVDLANRIAPEHLELLVKRPQDLLKGIRNAGTVFLGHYACESVGDYLAGPNHVLPTNGTARFFSPLGVYHFLKRMNVTGYSREALRKNGKHVIEMALAEDLFFHADAVRVRL